MNAPAALEVGIPGGGFIVKAEVTPSHTAVALRNPTTGGGGAWILAVEDPAELRDAARVLTSAARAMDALQQTRDELAAMQKRYNAEGTDGDATPSSQPTARASE